MDFSLTKEQEMLKKLAAQFAEEELEPVAAEIDAEHRFPTENFAKMAKVGFTGIGVPEEFGGSGGGMLEKVIAVSEFAKKCMSSAATLSIHLIAPHAILDFGTKEQKEKYLPRLTKGGELGAFALTEPNAGSDAAGVKTVAVYDEATDEYILNGTKCFITGGARAGVLVIFAMTEPKLGTRGMSAFIVEKGDEGFSIGKTEDKMGICASSTTELIFQNCVIPEDRLLGAVGDGFKVAMSTLDGGRIGIASQALGIAQGAFDVTVDYMNARKQFGKKLSQFQALQFEMADLKTRIEAARLLVYRAADMKDKHLNYGEAAAMAKLYAAETAMAVTTKCVQYHGGYGYTKDYPVERMMRDAKITEIYEGTSEVQRMVIAGKTFKK